ncbi:MAG: hypothetical protein ABSC94_23370 [Polyangiaceae bacterium]
MSQAATILLGSDQSTEAVADMLRELANVAGGAFVSVAEADRTSATTGLPTNGDPQHPWGPVTGIAREFLLEITGTPLEISIRIRIESREVESVMPKDLRPGMVIARNVCNDDGAVLLPAGVRITESSTARLTKLLSPAHAILVVAA